MDLLLPVISLLIILGTRTGKIMILVPFPSILFISHNGTPHLNLLNTTWPLPRLPYIELQTQTPPLPNASSTQINSFFFWRGALSFERIVLNSSYHAQVPCKLIRLGW